MTTLRIKGLGGFSEIGASGAQIEVLGNINKNLLVDSGVKMVNRKENGTFIRRSEGHNFPDKEIHAALITHGHADHVANLPYILSQYPSAKAFMTRPTTQIAGISWKSTVYLMSEKKIDADLHYQEEFVKGAKIATLENEENIIKTPGWTEIFPGIEAYFGPAGHIRGAAFVVIRAGGITIMFTGDISIFDSPTVKGMKLPEEFVGKLDAIFVEATYGDRVLLPREEEEDRMGYWAKRTLDEGGNCLAPAFGIGRSPDAYLAQLNYGIKPAFLDGMGKAILDIYADAEGSWCDLDQSVGIDLQNDPRIKFVEGRNHRQELIYEGDPFSVVTTAGMMVEGSCAWQYAMRNHFLENQRNTLLLTGFQAENTEGREIEEGIEGQRPVRLGGREIMVTARVPKRLQLSSHADGVQIADLVNKLRPRKVFIVHGYDAGRRGLKRNLENLGYRGEIHLPENEETIDL